MIKVILGDITLQKVDAIVNAANSFLLGGGGVDGAIHSAAGPNLLKECKQIGWCNPGDAKITKAYNLPAKHVIHTVGPIYSERPSDDKELASCYRRCLEVAVENNLETIAFPSISTGVYSFPNDRAAKIAHEEVEKFLSANHTIKEVIFVCFEKYDYECHLKI